MVVVGYILLALAAVGAHVCVLWPQLPEHFLRWILRRFQRGKKHDVFVPYYEVVRSS